MRINLALISLKFYLTRNPATWSMTRALNTKTAPTKMDAVMKMKIPLLTITEKGLPLQKLTQVSKLKRPPLGRSQRSPLKNTNRSSKNSSGIYFCPKKVQQKLEEEEN
jgi:hypothetical protein